MSKILVSPEEFILLYREHGQKGCADKLNVSQKSIAQHRQKVESRLGVVITGPGKIDSKRVPPRFVPRWVPLEVTDGYVVVFSDAHFWPGEPSTAYKGLLEVLRELGSNVKVIINNGDSLDGATISRHPPLNWDHQPSLIQELEIGQERLGEIEKLCVGARKIWNLGNHDARFEMRLAQAVPEFVRVHGFTLKDHFAAWEPTWATNINDELIVKHRWKGGVHAGWNNTIQSGKSFITGHTHQGVVTPFTDYNGTRFGVQACTLADPFAPAFEYAEDNPRNWISGFVVLKWTAGHMMWPQIARVLEPGSMEFMGRIYSM